MTNPVPEGFHTISPHITVAGAKKALEFYQKAFGAQIMWCNEMAGTDLIMNACVMIGDSPMMLNDAFPERGAKGPEGWSPVTIHLYVDDVDTWWKRAIDAGAEVMYPLENAFWGDRYGMLKDPFGHQWSIASKIEDVTPEQMKERAKAFAEQMAQG